MREVFYDKIVVKNGFTLSQKTYIKEASDFITVIGIQECFGSEYRIMIGIHTTSIPVPFLSMYKNHYPEMLIFQAFLPNIKLWDEGNGNINPLYEYEDFSDIISTKKELIGQCNFMMSKCLWLYDFIRKTDIIDIIPPKRVTEITYNEIRDLLNGWTVSTLDLYLFLIYTAKNRGYISMINDYTATAKQYFSSSIYPTNYQIYNTIFIKVLSDLDAPTQ